MKSMLLSLMCVVLITTGAFANMRFDEGYQDTSPPVSDHNFSTVGNWTTGWGTDPVRRLPGSRVTAGELCSIQAILPANGGPGTPYVVTLDQDFVDTTSTFILNVRHNQSAVANVLNISADLNSVSAFNVGWAIDASGIINQTDGDVTVGVLRVGSGAANDPAKEWPSTYALSGGTLTMTAGSIIGMDGTLEQTGGFFLPQGSLEIMSGGVMEISGGTMEHTARLNGDGTVRIIGDDATINLHQIWGGFTGTFEFEFDETGVSGIDNDSWGDLSDPNFLVDGDNFTSAGGDFVLYTGLYPVDPNGLPIPTAALGSDYVVKNLGVEGVDWTWNETTTDPHTITLTILSDSATNPSPTDGETLYGYGDAPELSWKAGETAVAHDVYFGNPLVFKERVTGTSYDPDVILAEGTYYWRIDAVDAGDVVYPGDVWSFIVVTSAASNPFPADEATGVATDVTLTWTAGSGNPTHDVWLGKAADALELVAEDLPATPAEYTPSLTKSLIKGMTYYWKIVEDDGANTSESPVFSFTVTSAAGECHWTNDDAGSNLWTSEANWNGGVPGVGSRSYIDPYTLIGGPCVIDDTVDAYAVAWLSIGVVDPNYVDTGDPTLVMTGGNLSVPRIGLGISPTGPGVINMTGGTMDIAVQINIGNHYNATFNMDGGTLNVGELSFTGITTDSIFNLNGGTVNADSIYLYGPYTLNIGGAGTLIINGDATATINAGVTSGGVIAYDGLGNVSVTYDGVADKTTVTASPDPAVRAGDDQDIDSLSTSVTATAWDPGGLTMDYEWTSSDPGVDFGTPTALTTTVTFDAYATVAYELTLTATNSSAGAGSDSVLVTAQDPANATDPNVPDGATGVAVDLTLSWTAGPGSISSDVWFGTDPEDLELVSDDQPGTTYAPGTLIKGQTYYWAVDEYDGAETHYGPTWSFTVVALAGGWTTWTGAGGSDLWNVEANWDNGVPGVGSVTVMHENGPILIDSSVEAVATSTIWNRWGITDPNYPTVLDMTGGSLTLYRWALGNGGPATVNISGGTVSILDTMLIGDGFDTTLNIDGGTVNVSEINSQSSKPSTNFINLNSGVLTASNIHLSGDDNPLHTGTTTLEISAGTLILDGNDTAVVQGYIDAGRIIAYGGTGTVVVDLDDADPEAITTTVTACTSVFDADMNYDCAVNIGDLRVLAQDWLSDFDLFDFAALAEEWLLDGL